MKSLLIILACIILTSGFVLTNCSEGDEQINPWNRLISDDSPVASTDMVSVPTFSKRNTVEYASALEVVIKVPYPDAATIIYTTDNTYPTSDSTCTPVNGKAISSGSTVTVKATSYLRAIGCMPDHLTSAVSSSYYNVSKKIFVTEAAVQGDFGGVAQADELCMVNRPDSLDYKALIVDETTRTALAKNQKNWVLLANTKYYRQDGTTLAFTTNSKAIFDYNDNMTNSFAGIGDTYWTGLNIYWETTAQTCGNWSSTTVDAVYGSDNQIDGRAIATDLSSCAESRKILCVEQ